MSLWASSMWPPLSTCSMATGGANVPGKKHILSNRDISDSYLHLSDKKAKKLLRRTFSFTSFVSMASILRIIILLFQCVFWWWWWLCHVTIPGQCLLCQLTVQILFYSLFICCSVCRYIWWVSRLKVIFQLFRKGNPVPRLICKEDNLNKNGGTWMIALSSVQLPRFWISVFLDQTCGPLRLFCKTAPIR